MKITLVTPFGTACGISEYAAYLKEAIEAASEDTPRIRVETNLHPYAVLGVTANREADWTILNYHAALHSQWLPEHVTHVQALGGKVLIIYHDTGVPNSDQCTALHAVADCFVVHEPCEDLPGAIYLRQGIPAAGGVYQYGVAGGAYGTGSDTFKQYWNQPVVGTVGFPFPWKNYDTLAEASATAGWALMLIAPGATTEQVALWQALNPWSYVHSTFLPREEVLARLSGCDATAFLYANANTGTSAAIRLGIAARKPVLASTKDACRQFRDLHYDKVGYAAIRWLDDLSVDGVAWDLANLALQPVDTGIVRLAHQDRWSLRGQQFATLLKGGVL